jgi:tetratricopeptide (TPR) repeat protein
MRPQSNLIHQTIIRAISMSKRNVRWTIFLTLLVSAWATGGCGVLSSSSTSPPPAPPLPVATALPADAEGTEKAIRFLEERVSHDHDDFIAYNKLAGYYLQRQRETGALNYIELALRAANASLAAMPAELNKSGLATLAQAEFAAHEFVAARDHALKLIEIERHKSYPYQILGDALVELGDYEKANAAYAQMEKLSTGISTETRLARAALLRGQSDSAERHFALALNLALENDAPQRETVAWIRWQLGEAAFLLGDYAKAEQHYRDALVTFPDYYRALAGLGRARAAQNDLPGAIENYERAVRIIPDPTFVAALGDLYKLTGRDRDAEKQYALVEQIGKLSVANGAVYNRQLALFYADHDLKATDAYGNATREYEVRRDIYGADAVAWTALKAGKLAEAQAASKEALKLGTRDARLVYHAGMIALAAGDKAAARDALTRVLSQSPQFDPLQAASARKALELISQ